MLSSILTFDIDLTLGLCMPFLVQWAKVGLGYHQKTILGYTAENFLFSKFHLILTLNFDKILVVFKLLGLKWFFWSTHTAKQPLFSVDRSFLIV